MPDEKNIDRTLRRLFFAGSAALLMFICAMMQYWYIYITRTENLYDVYGAQINAFLPAPLQNWGV